MAINFSDATPAAPGGSLNVKWQKDASGNVSAYLTGAAGTVTSVALSMPAEFAVTGSPVTGSGMLGVTKALQLQNSVYCGPAAGGTGPPVFRALVASDIPAGVGAVASVFGRQGAVVALAGDYTAAKVTNAVSTILTYPDPAWITSLAWAKLTGVPATFTPAAHTHDATAVVSGIMATARLGSGSPSIANYLRGDGTWATVTSAVTSVFGRSGAVVAAAGDYTVAQVTGAVPTSVTISAGAGLAGGGDLSANRTLAVIPATAGALGGVKIGSNVAVAADGTISVTAPYALNPATASVLGGVKIGANVAVQADGTISVATPYALPPATVATLGGVKVGLNISVAADGTISTPGPGTAYQTPWVSDIDGAAHNLNNAGILRASNFYVGPDLTGGWAMAVNLPVTNGPGRGLIIHQMNPAALSRLSITNDSNKGTTFGTFGSAQTTIPAAPQYNNAAFCQSTGDLVFFGSAGVFANQEIMRLTGSGLQVGIGTASPQYTLDVTGTIRATGTMFAASAAIDGAITANIVTAAAGLISVNGAAGTYRYMTVQTAGVSRWLIGAAGNAESGGNAGSDFLLASFTDAGADLRYPIYIPRATGFVGINGNTAPAYPLDVAGDIHTSGNISANLTMTCAKTVLTDPATANPSMLVLSSNGSTNAYINFADVSIGGQGLGAAFLRWTRDSGLGRKFGVYVGLDAGGSTLALEADYTGVVNCPNGINAGPANNPVATYATGTWTPVFGFCATQGDPNTFSSAGVTYTYRHGGWARAGKIVTVFFAITLSSKGTAPGGVMIAGLPFTAAETATAVFMGLSGSLTAMTMNVFTVPNGWPDLFLYNQLPNGNIAFMTDANCSNFTDIQGSITYQITGAGTEFDELPQGKLAAGTKQ